MDNYLLGVRPIPTLQKLEYAKPVVRSLPVTQAIERGEDEHLFDRVYTLNNARTFLILSSACLCTLGSG